MFPNFFKSKEIPFDPSRRKFLTGFVSFSVFSKLLIDDATAQIKTDEDQKILAYIRNSLEEASKYEKLIRTQYGIRINFSFDKKQVKLNSDEGAKLEGIKPYEQLRSVQYLYESLLRFPPKRLKKNLNQFVTDIYLASEVKFLRGKQEDSVSGLNQGKKIYIFASNRIFFKSEKYSSPISVFDPIVKFDFDHEIGHTLDSGLTEDTWISGVNGYLETQKKKARFNPKYIGEEKIAPETKNIRPRGFVSGYSTKSWREDFAEVFARLLNPYAIIDYSNKNEADLEIIEAKEQVVKAYVKDKLGLRDDYFTKVHTLKTAEEWTRYWDTYK